MSQIASLPNALRENLASCGFEVVKHQLVGGGCISNAAVFVSSTGETYFLKWNANAPERFFHAEAEGLRALREADALPVPEVFCAQDTPNKGPAFILLEALVPGESSKTSSEQLGRGLARLHRVSQERYGFEADNFIGLLPQSNSWSSSWSEFFFEQRILPQVELASQNGWFTGDFDSLLARKEKSIRSMLDANSEPASLIHGDLWAGNIFWSENGPCLIDPAVYYGSREADIAFTELFGRFDQIFYDAYQEEFPLLDGYQARRRVLNLYHLMTHSNLFGGSYIQQVYATLKSL